MRQQPPVVLKNDNGHLSLVEIWTMHKNTNFEFL